MVRQRLTSPRFHLLLLVGAVALGGCVGAYQPAPGERPPVVDPSGPPLAEPIPAPPPGPLPAPAETRPAPVQNNAEAPTLALLQQSQRAADGGDLAGAIAYVERAIRLNSRDAALWLRLAGLQLQAERPATAEQLAQKAIALAGNRDDQKRQGWLLVADAREAQGDAAAAERIRERWRTFRG
ncbi:MAG: hypothetical protein RIC56_14435 [Pseudomonadales bacterium]